MPTSATFPASPDRRQRGFTLLEMIAVLAIMGLVAGLVGPSMLRGVDAWKRAAEIDRLLDQVRSLPGRARAGGHDIEISQQALAGAVPPLRVEAGWQLVVDAPWRVRASGVCEGGMIEARAGGSVRRVRVAPPFCDPTLQ